MKIVNAVYGDSTGGRWAATLKTGRLLAGRGHEVILLIDPVDAPKVPAEDAAVMELVTLKNSGHFDAIASWKAGRLLLERGIDAVIAHSGRAIHMLKRAAPRNMPVIAFNHSHNIKRTLKADAFFCITPYMKTIVDEATGGSKPAFVISNAITVPPAEVLVPRKDGVFTVGAMGRMVANKGLHHLVAALGILAREGVAFQATIAGDGEDRGALERLAEAAGIRDRIAFPGWIGAEQKAEFYNGLDVMCFTSESDVQPLVILETLAWGKALIGTDIPGPSTCYTDGETALVVPPGDPEALAAALLRLRNEPGLRARLGAAARRKAIECHADEVVAEFLDARLREVVDSMAVKKG